MNNKLRTEPRPDPAPPERLVVFDGICVMCSFLARLLGRIDRHHRFRFVTAQSPLGAEIFARHGLKTSDYETAIVMVDGKLFTKLDGLTAVARELGWPWRVLTALDLLPQSWRDATYDLIARTRYRWFGRKDQCVVPPAWLKERFLD